MRCASSIGLALSFVCTAGLHAQQVRPAQTARLTGVARDMVCAPASPPVKPVPTMVVVGGREHRRTLFGTGDVLVVRGGASQGVKPGDEFFIRRVVDDRYSEHEPGVYPISVTTAGTAQVLEAQAAFSVATVTHSCDGILEGDYLERYEAPAAPAATVDAAPDFASPGRLILGADRRQIGAPGEFMIIDRGSDHGLRQGQQLTIFRRIVADGPVATVGVATVFSVQPGSSVVRIERSTDAVWIGDLVAIHR
jgi:hypothetical protein